MPRKPITYARHRRAEMPMRAMPVSVHDYKNKLREVFVDGQRYARQIDAEIARPVSEGLAQIILDEPVSPVYFRKEKMK